MKFSFKKSLLAVLAAVGLCSATVGFAGCMPKSIDLTAPEGAFTQRLTPPDDGSLPTAHTCAENLAYLVSKFDSQTQYHTYSYGVTSASIATQTTRTWRDYKDGVLITTDLTFSSMVKGGTQTCTVFTEDENGEKVGNVYFRPSATPEADTLPTTAEWSTEAPVYFSENAYFYTYGLLPNELFNYLVNEQTIVSSEELQVESDGTYTQKFVVDPKISTFYYQFGMKTRGGLSDYPDFKSIEITVNFDSQWQINSCTVHEVSSINKGIIVSSISDFTVEYYYGEDHFDDAHYAYYNDYYSKYLGDENLEQGGSVEEELVMDVANMLSNGFSQIMNGGQQFEISVKLGDNVYVGYVYASLDLADIAGTIHIKISLGKTFEEQSFYLEYGDGGLSAYYGDDFAIGANMAEVKLAVGEFGDIIDKVNNAIAQANQNNGDTTQEATQGEEGGSALDGLLDKFMASMVLTPGEKQAVITLDNTFDQNGCDPLGLGIDFKLEMIFGISGNTVSFRGATLDGLAGEEGSALALALKATTAEEIYRDPNSTTVNLSDYIADVHSLLASDIVKVHAVIDGSSEKVALSALKNVKADVTAYVNLGGIAVGADINVSYMANGAPVSASISAVYEYNESTGKYGKVYLNLTSLNNENISVKIKCDIAEIADGISSLLTLGGAPASLSTNGLADIIKGALSTDFTPLISELYADGAKIKIAVSVDTILDMLNIDAGAKLGSCALVYERGEEGNGGRLAVELPAVGFLFEVTGEDENGQIAVPNDDDYLDVNAVIKDIREFLNASYIAVGINFDGSAIQSVNGLTANATAYVGLKDGLTAKVVANVSYVQNDNTLSARIALYYTQSANADGMVVLSLEELCGRATNVKLYCNINEVAEGVKTLLASLGVSQITTPSIALPEVDVAKVLANLLTADINKILPEFTTTKISAHIKLNADELIKLFVDDLGFSVGEVTLDYNQEGENLLWASVPNLGLDVAVNAYDEQLEPIDTTDALNLADVISDVNSIVSAKKLAVSLGLDGTALKMEGLTANATVLADLNEGIAAKVIADVTYNNLSAKISAYYSYDSATYGNVVLCLDELCGVARDVKICCQIDQLVDGVKTLLTYFGTTQTANTTDGQTDGNAITLSTVISNLLSADIDKLLPNIYAGANVFNLTVNVDEVLKIVGVSTGVTIGEVSLAYEHGGVNLLTANVPEFGVTANINPYTADIEVITPDNALNLADVLADVNSVLDAKKLAINIGVDGSSINNEALKGIQVDATAYVDLSDVLDAQANDTKIVVAQLDANLAYTYNNKTISAHLVVCYQGGATDSGKVVLLLDELNGTAVNIKLGCKIDEVVQGVKTLIDYVTPKAQLTEPATTDTTTDTTTQKNTLSEIVSKILSADINALIPELSATTNLLNLSVNADELLKLLNVQLGVQLGNVALEYTHLEEGEQGNLLTATIPAVGATVTVNPTDSLPEIPSDIMEGCFELSDLVDTVNNAFTHINTIKADQRIGFAIPKEAEGQTHGSYLLLDGIKVCVWGEGEVSWKTGAEYIALDLGMSISETGTDVTTLKFYYNKNAVDTPMVRIALNNVGIDIYKEDIDGVKNGFVQIYNKLAPILGMQPITSGTTQNQPTTTEGSTSTDATAAATSPISTDELLNVIIGVLAKDNWVGALNDFTATTDGTSLAISYLAENALNVEIATEGGLSLTYDGRFGERFSLAGDVSAYAVDVSFVSALEAQMNETVNMVSSKDGNAKFTRLVYNFLFDAIHSISVENILGSDTYSVVFELNGDNCNIKELAGVYINAELYITGEESQNSGKIAEGLLNINVAGVVINLHVITEYSGGQARFFINLNQVADIKLPDLKVYATQDSLYDTLDVIVSALNDTNVLDVIKGLLPKNDTTGATQPVETTPTDGGATANNGGINLASLLEKIINFNFKEAVLSTEADGVMTADIDLNNIFSQLGLTHEGDLGNVQAVINHNDHSMTTNAQADVIDAHGNVQRLTWMSLSSAKTDRRDYSQFKREDYISIEFLPDMISDIVKFATDDNGDVYKKFTLSGSINASIVSIINLNIDVSTLTVSISDNDFYFSGLLHVNRLSVLIATIPESTVGISFHNGYLTLARGVNSANPEYKIMTMDYFLDHMLVDKGSVLEWWLNVSGWDTIMGIINKAAGDLNVSSGLTTPQDVYLYEAKSDKEDQEISMYDFVEALRVVINGNQTASFGDISPLEKDLGVNNNYYGFALNAGKITNGVLTKLYAALLRNDNGISGVKASGAIQSYVKFSATLNYEEGITNEYVMGTALNSGVVAPSMYDKANEVINAAGATVNYNHDVKNPEKGYDEVFGCFSTADMSHDPSNVLYQHTLTIVNLDGTTQTRLVRHGSTVYLYDNYSPVYTDDTEEFRLLYSTSADTVGQESVVMNSDLTVYAVRRTAVKVIAHNGATETVISSFVDDTVPTGIKGYETISDVTYSDGTVVGANDVIKTAEPIEIYGTFVKTEIEVNFVKYSFDASTSSYTVTGRAAGFNAEYCDGDNPKTLVLENSIDGYPVTKIADGALKDTEGHAIKNVVVPANITYVGLNAFSDNLGMQSVVFFAPEVTIAGSFDEGEAGNTTPFYGCSTEKDGTSTNLSIYYNSIVYEGSSTNLLWTRFRRAGSGAIFSRYYVGCDPRKTAVVDYDKNGGGTLYSAGQWSYVSTTISGAESVTELDIESEVKANVPNGIISGSYTQTQGDTLKTNLEAKLASYKNDLGESKYVVNVKVTANNGNVTVAVSVSLNVPVEINVNSEVAFTYTLGANVQSFGAGASKVKAVSAGENVLLYAPVASGYTFLGWAKQVDGVLTFVGESTAYEPETVYYAIWGTSKVGTAFSADVNTAGSTLSAPVATGIDGKWYDANWNEVTAISTANTVVYTRNVYSLSINISGGTDNGIANKKTFFYINDAKVGEGKSCSYNVTEFKILEGENYKVTNDGTNKYTVSSDKNSITVYAYMMKRNSIFSSNWTQNYIQTMSGYSESFTVQGNVTLNFTAQE